LLGDDKKEPFDQTDYPSFRISKKGSKSKRGGANHYLRKTDPFNLIMRGGDA